ncbi:MAG: InlB B-repeat-containing protein, partial [Clostridiales bacterium]|nr:InlB B-repeat-containing protein [Clostridiales bacterium]
MLALIMTAAMVLSLAIPAFAATVTSTTAAIRPSAHTTGSGSSAVSNPNRAYDDDNSTYGTWDSSSDTATFSGFTLGIPSDATITNIRVNILGARSSSGQTRNLSVSVSTNNGSSYSTAQNFGYSGTSAQTVSRDYSQNLSASGINSNLRVRVNGSSSSTLYVYNLAVTVTYSRQNYTVTYNANGTGATGAPTDPNSPYFQGATVTVLDKGTMARSGYTFIGWNTNQWGTGTNYAVGDTFTMGAANRTLYARWAQNYAVTYNANGGTGALTDPNSPYIAGDVVTVLGKGSMARDGFEFAGWNTAADGSGTPHAVNSTFSMGSSNVILYAQWTPITYALTVNASPAGGGTATGAGTYASGASVNISATPAAEAGYRFVNWTSSNGGSFGDATSESTTFTMPGSATTVTANFALNEYTVTFKDFDGAVLDTQTIEHGLGATAPDAPSREPDAQYSYGFTGWDKAFDNITGDLIVTAQYSETTNSYTVTFKDWDGAVLDTQTVAYGLGATAPDAPSREPD